MTITKAQWEAVTEDLKRLNRQLQDLRSEVDYLRYKRVPDVERRVNDGAHNNNH